MFVIVRGVAELAGDPETGRNLALFRVQTCEVALEGFARRCLTGTSPAQDACPRPARRAWRSITRMDLFSCNSMMVIVSPAAVVFTMRGSGHSRLPATTPPRGNRPDRRLPLELGQRWHPAPNAIAATTTIALAIAKMVKMGISMDASVPAHRLRSDLDRHVDNRRDSRSYQREQRNYGDDRAHVHEAASPHRGPRPSPNAHVSRSAEWDRGAV